MAARALGVEANDLGHTVTCSLGDLRAIIRTESDVVLDVDTVAGLALSLGLGTDRVGQGGSTGIMVQGVVATGEEGDYIGAAGIELGRNGLLGGGEDGESAQGEGVADGEGHDYYNINRVWMCLYGTRVGTKP